jgi:hypothetical protein
MVRTNLKWTLETYGAWLRALKIHPVVGLGGYPIPIP